MKRNFLPHLLAALSFMSIISVIPPAEAQQRVTCESNNERTRRCSIDTSNGIRLDEQLSNTSCNGKWRVGDDYVEVWDGCRARFSSIRGNSNSNRDRVLCESNDGRRKRCGINTSGGVRLVRKLSSSSCDSRWAMGNGFVEVWSGCRAEFAANSYSNLPKKVTCESNDNRIQRCRIDTSRGVRLTRKFSSTTCHNNWRTGDDYVEVRNGCRAEFSVDRN